MNWKNIFFFGIVFIMIVAGCSIGPSEKPEFNAAEEFARVYEIATRASYTGDSSELFEYMEKEEGGKILKKLLEADGVNLEPVVPKRWAGFWLPFFNNTKYFADGDILLSRDYGNAGQNLLDWLIPSKYTHSGVLNQHPYCCCTEDDCPDPNSGAVMSASFSVEEGLTFQSYKDWACATTVTRMRVINGLNDKLEAGKSAFCDYFCNSSTEYKFVYYDPNPDVKDFVVVPNIPEGSVTINYKYDDDDTEYEIEGDPKHWHCAKTVWWIYYKMGYKEGLYYHDVNASNDNPDLDVENNDWYFRPGLDIRTFGFYKLYKALFRNTQDEDIILKKLKRAIELAAIPDEIRYATTPAPKVNGVQTEGGPLNGDQWSWCFNRDGIITWGMPEWLLTE